jgi:hypothetical protein
MAPLTSRNSTFVNSRMNELLLWMKEHRVSSGHCLGGDELTDEKETETDRPSALPLKMPTMPRSLEDNRHHLALDPMSLYRSVGITVVPQ